VSKHLNTPLAEPTTSAEMEPPFRFALQRVRDVRAHDEDRAKEQFAASLSQRVRGEAMLRAVEERLRDARRQSALAQPAVRLTGSQLVAEQAWVERLERKRRDAVANLERCEAELRKRREALTEASRRREALDQLAARQRDQHRREWARREGAELDEMALRAYARGRAA